MELIEMMNEELVKFDFEADSKEDAINKIGNLMYESKIVSDKEKYIEGVFQREKECSTGIGMGVAIPHCKCNAVNKAAFALIKLKNEMEWSSLDNEPVKYIIMLAAPDNSDNIHLKMLSLLAKNLMEDDFRNKLIEAESIETIKNLFREGER
ncbi:PTS system fructose-specific IIA component [Lachnotalea glycerini]|uniref:PTS sugar transporter subunit IIA n=1 Tax=Lachnotalea glycerini TaxID=1763509 RepID=A0A255IQI7_9FIRM|nr:PTS sugar transporter subunit IIA [Lachnotalea glycerini]PXV88333.1 PTS system fructose-specific IIA component [Lachnotalea glycerini]RDY27129.1 PTS sugar transporter subunit IIA [Lachnotalea glycerini]